MDVASIAAQFAVAGPVASVEPQEAGHIHASFVVACRDGPARRRYILQRINRHVFPDIGRLMENIQCVTAHVTERLRGAGVADVGRRGLSLVPTTAGYTHVTDADGWSWRMYDFIEGSRTVTAVRNAQDAATAGRAFGEFQAMLADLPVARLCETIPDFHNTPRRVEALKQAIATDRPGRAGSVASEIAFARRHAWLADRLLRLHHAGDAPQRIVHNDAKISNVLLDEASGEALCVIDLDTVMPGLSLYDFGDMVRSMTHRAAEDAADASAVQFDPDLYEALAGGYLSQAADFLTPAERASLPLAGVVIAYEQGVRFLTDYLEGDPYYRTTRPGQNLDRARVHFALVHQLLDCAPVTRSAVRR